VVEAISSEELCGTKLARDDIVGGALISRVFCCDGFFESIDFNYRFLESTIDFLFQFSVWFYPLLLIGFQRIKIRLSLLLCGCSLARDEPFEADRG